MIDLIAQQQTNLIIIGILLIISHILSEIECSKQNKIP
jgi:hypothetical protein